MVKLVCDICKQKTDQLFELGNEVVFRKFIKTNFRKTTEKNIKNILELINKNKLQNKKVDELCFKKYIFAYWEEKS